MANDSMGGFGRSLPDVVFPKNLRSIVVVGCCEDEVVELLPALHLGKGTLQGWTVCPINRFLQIQASQNNLYLLLVESGRRSYRYAR